MFNNYRVWESMPLAKVPNTLGNCSEGTPSAEVLAEDKGVHREMCQRHPYGRSVGFMHKNSCLVFMIKVRFFMMNPINKYLHLICARPPLRLKFILTFDLSGYSIIAGEIFFNSNLHLPPMSNIYSEIISVILKQN